MRNGARGCMDNDWDVVITEQPFAMCKLWSVIQVGVWMCSPLGACPKDKEPCE